MQELSKFISDCGFSVPAQVVPDGKLHRFAIDRDDKKESGYYIFFQNYASKSGQPFYAGICGSWRTGESFNYTSSIPYSKEDRALSLKRMAEAQKKAAEEKRMRQEEAAQECQRRWAVLAEGISDYHKAKGLTESYGARAEDTFYGCAAWIPVQDVDGKIWSLQKIQKNEDGFSKKYYPGGRISGCFHVIGGPDLGETIYVAEGFATAASIHAAIGKPVVCAFDSGNLKAVTGELKRRYPDKAIIICGDEDTYSQGNPGRTKAEEAAKGVMGKAVFPVFSSSEGKPTDWDDLRRREGLAAVQEQIEGVKAERAAVIPLGFSGSEYYYISTHNEQISVLTSFSDTQFFNLMVKEYWETAYPNGKGGVDWLQAKSDMMAQARERGLFEQRNVRGAGVWIDKGRVVVNMGNYLLVDGKRMRIQEIKSRFIYTLGRPLPELEGVEPLTHEECELLVNITDSFKWKNPAYGRLVAGFLVVSKVCGALPIRPHVWVTGEAGSGKSTLLERLIFKTLEGHSHYFHGGTSEAGVRQSLRADAIPVIFDEFETMNQRSKENIQACVDLMRSSWSETHGFIAKGSASGAVSLYQPRFSAVVSSIRTGLASDADRSRFTKVELVPHKSDAEHWQRLDAMLTAYDQEFVERLFVRSLAMLPTILENAKKLKSALASKVSSRFGQQYGMLLAGFAALITDGLLCDEECEILISGLDALEDEKEAALASDQYDCLTALLTTKLRLSDGNGATIGDLLRSSHIDDLQTLRTHGILVGGNEMFVAYQHGEIQKIFRQTRWEHNLADTLMRVKGAEKGRRLFSGSKLHCVKLPIGG